MDTGLAVAIIILVLYVFLVNTSWFLCSNSYLILHKTMRKLWTDHVFWTREYVILAIENLATKQYAADRLMQNQVDIGNAFGIYYGCCAGQQLTGLLKDHIGLAVQLISAMQEKSSTVDDLNKQWYTNADQIAQFLHDCNPELWPAMVMQQMMHDHLHLTTAEITKYLYTKQGDKSSAGQDIPAFDAVLKEILQMADMLTDGIARQQRWKFLI